MAIMEGEIHRLCMPQGSRIIIIMMYPRELTLPLLMEGPTIGAAVGHGEPREVQALVSDLLLVTILKERVKASLIVGKWDVCISAKGKVRALRPTDAHFPTILISQCMSLRVKVKGNAKDLICLVPLRPQDGVGETPHEDATPPEVVRLLADQAGGDQ